MKELEEDKTAKDEEVRRLRKELKEQQSAMRVLKDELDHIKHSDNELLLQLESQKKEFELECNQTIQSLELQLKDSYQKLMDMEASAAREMSDLRRKDGQYQKYLAHQLLEYKVRSSLFFFTCPPCFCERFNTFSYSM